MKFLIALIILGSDGASTDLDRSEINKSIQNIRSVPLEHNGEEGVWYPKADAELLLGLIGKLSLALDIIDDQSKQIKYLKISKNSYKEASQQYKGVAVMNKDMFNIAMTNLSSLEPVDYAWYETPTATFLYGLAVGVGVILFSSWIVKNTIGSEAWTW
jgi:hypothetical protein